jgi:hypothetical protein
MSFGHLSKKNQPTIPPSFEINYYLLFNWMDRNQVVEVDTGGGHLT